MESLLEVVLEGVGDRVAVVRGIAAAVASKIILHVGLDVEKCKERLGRLLGSAVWYVRFGGLEVVKGIVGSKGYLKMWEAVRGMKGDNVMSVKMKLVEVADRISEHGVKSCSEEVKEIRGEAESMY